MTSYNGIILKFVLSLIESLNEKKLDQISKLFLEEVKLESPNVIDLFPENIHCKLEGKRSVIKFWEKLFVLKPNLHITVNNVRSKNKMISFEADFHAGISKMVSFIQVNEYGKIIDMKFEYLSVLEQNSKIVYL